MQADRQTAPLQQLYATLSADGSEEEWVFDDVRTAKPRLTNSSAMSTSCQTAIHIS